MLLKRVKYHNFRPFIGNQEIKFTQESGKNGQNVTVILGQNTFGKSTFVLSFIWCLYGESRFDHPNDILNKKVEKKMSFGQQETAWVEVEFEDGDCVYTVRRTQLFTMGQKGHLNTNDTEVSMSYVTSKGETKNLGKFQHEVNDAIRAILPVDLSSFFFFEGEKDNAIKKKDLGRSVRTLLGLEAFENMRKHLHGESDNPAAGSVMGYYLDKEGDESDDKAKKELEKKTKAEADLAEILKRIEEIRSEIKSYETKIDQINESLRQAAPSKELQKRRDAIKKELAEQEETLKKNYKKLLKLFSTDSMPLFIMPFLDKAADRLREMDVADKGIKGIEATAILELLGRGVCLCGTDLKPGTLAYKNVEKYIDYIPPKSVGTLVRDMLETIDGNEEKSKKFIEEFEDIYKDIQKNKARIDELEREEKEKLAEIAKIGNVDTTDAEQNLYTYKQRINELTDELEKRCSEEGSKRSEISTAENNFNMYKSKSDKAKEYHLYYSYAEALYNWVNVNYNKKEQSMRERLSDYVAELFNNMYSGKREVVIDDQYNISVVSDDGNMALTGGLKVIAYFAFVGGLVKLAYEVMQEREQDEEGNAQTLGEHYPLVLDAAFSHADETHTKNIAKELAGAAHQLVFAVMPKDWAYAKEGLTGKVSKIYELKKIDESEAQIVEVN